MKYKIVHQFPDVQTELAWRDLLNRLEFPAHYDSPEYFLEPFWSGKQPFAIVALEGDRMAAVLTGIHDGEQVVCGLPSRPQIAVDAAGDVNAALTALLQGLFKEAEGAKMIAVHTWPSLDLAPFTAGGFRRRKLQGNVVLDLTQGADALFRQFSEARRRNIRLAEKHGVTVRIASEREDFRCAYVVYRAWHETERKKVKGEVRSFENFEAGHLLKKNRRLFMAELSGKVIAISMFRFYPHGLFEYAANCSLDEFLHLKPNDLLQWKGIEWACSHGLRRHSLGGAHPFLTRFGGTIVPILRYRLDRSLLRRHDLQEIVADAARQALRRMPAPIQEKVRRVFTRK